MSPADTTTYNSRVGTLLTRGPVVAPGSSLGAGATAVIDAQCAGDSELVVEVDMNGSAIGDVAVAAWPYESDGLTVMPVPIPTTQTIANVATGGKVYSVNRFDVDAYEKVQVRLTNNNAGAQTVNRASWRVQ